MRGYSRGHVSVQKVLSVGDYRAGCLRTIVSRV